MKKFVFLAVAGLSLSTCATVTKGGTSENVHFRSHPSGLDVEMSNGMRFTTLCQLKISRKESFVATFKRGNDKRTIVVETRMRGSGGAALAGNILVGGIVGIGVDAATGSTLVHVPNPVIADFGRPQSEQRTADEFVRQERENYNSKVESEETNKAEPVAREG
ncbi:translation initiation factor 2 [Rhodobacteraceae bacterium 4F10]|nr:translation initiation factor 2 [Rhodobacteraceae bacterium 4F10]